jgi:hypothetical protein
MRSRIALANDLIQISEIILSNPTMYGTDIIPRHDSFIKEFSIHIEADNFRNAPIVYDDGQIKGIVIQHLWKEMPFWSAGHLFIKSNIVSRALLTETVDICHDLLDFMLNNAEQNKYFDYLSVVRTGLPDSRDKFLSNKFKTEYHINLLETLGPHEIPKFTTHQKLMGATLGKNTKPVSIRHASKKKELRS